MRVVLIAACLAMALAAVWSLWPEARQRPAASLDARRAAADSPAYARGGKASPARGLQWMASVPASPPVDVTPAWSSLAQAREHGDDRAPPLQVPSGAVLGPTPAQLADPAAYRGYEQGQQARTLAAFASAADEEIPRLRADVERARAAGIAPGEIAKVEAKIARLERLRNGIKEDGGVHAD
jgi:hypothetical protein